MTECPCKMAVQPASPNALYGSGSHASGIIIADSITRIGPEAAGAVVVNASHGGIYAAYLAARLHASAAIFNDASVGLDRAGIRRKGAPIKSMRAAHADEPAARSLCTGYGQQ
jgi:hypothetical protein